MNEETKANGWDSLAAELGAEVRPESEALPAPRPPAAARPPQQQRTPAPPKPVRKASWDEVASELGLPPPPGEEPAPETSKVVQRAEAGATQRESVESPQFTGGRKPRERAQSPGALDREQSGQAREEFRPARQEARPRAERTKTDDVTRRDDTREAVPSHQAARERGPEERPRREGDERGGRKRRRRGGRSRSGDREQRAGERPVRHRGEDGLSSREGEDFDRDDIARDLREDSLEASSRDAEFLEETIGEHDQMLADEVISRERDHAEFDSGEPEERKGRRRRRRGRGRGGRGDTARNDVNRTESIGDNGENGDELEDEEPASFADTAMLDAEQAATLEESPEDQDEGHDDEREKHSHRSIPSWRETVGVLIEANLATRARNPHGTPSHQRRGGRSRRGGRGRSGKERS